MAKAKAAEAVKKPAAKKPAPAKKAERQATGTPAREIVSPITGLSAREALFVLEYMKDQNATRSAKAVGYKDTRAAEEAGRRLLLKQPVIDALASLMKERADRLRVEHITLERTLLEIGRIAYFDQAKIYGEEGELLSPANMDEDTRRAIASVEVERLYDGKESIGTTTKVKAHPKGPALDMLMKHLGGYLKDNEQRGNVLKELLDFVEKANDGPGLPIKR